MSAKYTKTLLDKINATRSDKPIEVIIQVSDLASLEQSQDIEKEMQRTQRLMAELVTFLTKLEKNGENVKMLDASWLTHSVLAIATPSVLRELVKRDDVNLIDLNTEIRLNDLGQHHQSPVISSPINGFRN
jgi:hypothetical protein